MQYWVCGRAGQAQRAAPQEKEKPVAKLYRAAQHWNRWLTQPLGRSVMQAEKKILVKYLAALSGKYGILIGVPEQGELLKASKISPTVLLTPIIHKNTTLQTIESDLHELPIASGSVDLVCLPHSLEHMDNPQRLLAEACRIVKPEGHIVILGFNPWSFWGLKKSVTRDTHTPWNHHFIQLRTIKKWLQLADFELIKQDFILYRPPFHHPSLHLQLRYLDWLARLCFKPFGGVYIVVAQAKVVPLTPIRLRWEQTFSNIRMTIPGPSMRKF